MNATSGRVTLNGQLNREVVDRYLLTAEAKDGGGLITFVTLNVTVLDVNDQSPSFTRDEYYVTVPEDRTQFLRGDLVVKVIHSFHVSFKTGPVTTGTNDCCLKDGLNLKYCPMRMLVTFEHLLRFDKYVRLRLKLKCLTKNVAFVTDTSALIKNSIIAKCINANMYKKLS